MRKSDLFFIYMSLNLALACAAIVHSHWQKEAAKESIQLQATMVRDLQLTDLALFTEARYTRNPSQADWNTAFQDHPMSLEHFPSGSIVEPPAALRRQHR